MLRAAKPKKSCWEMKKSAIATLNRGRHAGGMGFRSNTPGIRSIKKPRAALNRAARAVQAGEAWPMESTCKICPEIPKASPSHPFLSRQVRESDVREHLDRDGGNERRKEGSVECSICGKDDVIGSLTSKTSKTSIRLMMVWLSCHGNGQ